MNWSLDLSEAKLNVVVLRKPSAFDRCFVNLVDVSQELVLSDQWEELLGRTPCDDMTYITLEITS